MSLINFDVRSADATIFVSFPMQAIDAVHEDILREYLWDTVMRPRNDAQEHLYVESSDDESVVDIIKYQFGDLYNIEYECEDVAEELQEKIEEWIEEMGGYDIVKPKASALTESS